MVFGFWFLVFVYNTASPVVGTLLPAKTWARATVLSAFIGTVRFRSIRLRDCTTNNTYKNGINIRTYPAMQPQAAAH